MEIWPQRAASGDVVPLMEAVKFAGLVGGDAVVDFFGAGIVALSVSNHLNI